MEKDITLRNRSLFIKGVKKFNIIRSSILEKYKYIETGIVEKLNPY